MAQATHPRLRASLIGAALMTSAVAIAIYVVPAAEAPYERPEGGGCHLPNPGYNIYEQCGGYSVPFLTHEHREAAGPVTRFELFPGGEWRFTKIGAGDVLNGCTGSTSLRELKELAAAATWKREPLSTTCDVIPSGTEAWLVDGLEKLAYNACDREQPDPQTEKVIERMLAIEGSDSPSAIQHGDCPRGALACYEWLGSTWADALPESKFVVEDSGTWELTQRDVQTDAITRHKTGALAAAEVAALRDRIAHASWKLVEQQGCRSDNDGYGVGTVAVRGRSLTYGPCSGQWPDRSTQTTIDYLFAIYRSALRSNPHI
jgi:hypothetical protein